jgi:hypothetical protein
VVIFCACTRLSKGLHTVCILSSIILSHFVFVLSLPVPFDRLLVVLLPFIHRGLYMIFALCEIEYCRVQSVITVTLTYTFYNTYISRDVL